MKVPKKAPEYVISLLVLEPPPFKTSAALPRVIQILLFIRVWLMNLTYRFQSIFQEGFELKLLDLQQT